MMLLLTILRLDPSRMETPAPRLPMIVLLSIVLPPVPLSIGPSSTPAPDSWVGNLEKFVLSRIKLYCTTPSTPFKSIPSNTSCPWSRSSPLLKTSLYLAVTRSEEHTSELQSRLHLVCRLLL